MGSSKELDLLMKYLHKRREEDKIKEKERKKEEEKRRLELKEMLRELQESWQKLRKLMELEMQKWYLPVKKKITWPIQKIIQNKKRKEETQKIKEDPKK